MTAAPVVPPPYLPPPAAPSAPRDTRARSALVVAVVMNGAYAVQLLVDVARPRRDPEDQPVIGVLSHLYPGYVHVLFYAVVSGWALAAVLGTVAVAALRTRTEPMSRARLRRRWQLVCTAVLFAPYAVFPLAVLGDHPGYALVCLPSTAFALWTVHRMQRHRRAPFRLLLSVFGWGLLIGSGFGGSMNIWVADYALAFQPVRLNTLKTLYTVESWTFLSAGLFEECGKGAGVALAYLLYRRYFDNVVSGIVLGAAAGLGFNLAESVEYMSANGGLSAGYQYWVRQSAGLMAAHMAFSAAVGAGFGIARQLGDPAGRRTAIACGYAAAAGGHFANDVMLRYFGGHTETWFGHPGPRMQVFVVTPLQLVVLQGPFVLLYLVLLRRGLRDQAAALQLELDAEARGGSGAVTEREVPVLVNPARRFRLKVDALRREGLAEYGALGRLHAAQLALGMQRWHRSRGEADPWATEEPALRHAVLRLKYAKLAPYLPAARQTAAAPAPEVAR